MLLRTAATEVSIFALSATVGGGGVLWAQQGFTVDPVSAIALVTTAGGVIALLFRLLISSKDQIIASREREFALEKAAKDKALLDLEKQKDKELAKLESTSKSWQEIAKDGYQTALAIKNAALVAEGRMPIVPLEPVISKANSPSTQEQRDESLYQTYLAGLAHLKKMSGLQPKPEPPKGVEPAKPGVPPTEAQAALAAGVRNEAQTTRIVAATEKAADASLKAGEEQADRIAKASEQMAAATEKVAVATEKVAVATEKVAEK